MDFTPRIRDILLILLHAGGPVTKQEIADRLGVSKRTAQRECDYLEDVVKHFGLSVGSQKGSGIYLEGTQEAMEQLRAELSGGTVIGAEDKEERCRRILFELLKDRTPQKLYYFSNMLGVSEATAANDMEQLRPWLSRYHLELIKRPGYGVSIDGREEDFRAAMRRFIDDNGSAEFFATGHQALEEAVRGSLHKKSIYRLLKQDTVDRVKQILSDLDEPAFHVLAETAYVGLVIHISIAVERVRSGGTLSEQETALWKNLESWEEYGPAQRVIRRIEQEFGLDMPRSETAYLMLHLRASKTAYIGTAAPWMSEDPEMSRKNILAMIDQMAQLYNPELAGGMKTDEEFLEGLLMHLRPVLVRLQHHLDIYNPMLGEIKTEYPDEFARCTRAAAVLAERTGRAISEEEIGFLTMHFGAEEEKLYKKYQTRRKVHIGIVCASGFGLARLMQQRIQNHIEENIALYTYGRTEVTPYIAGKIDFFVSSFDLSEEGVDFIAVSPLINQQDIEQIRAKVIEYACIRRSAPDADFSMQLGQANQATQEIKGLIARYRHFQVSSNMSFPELLRYLSIKATTNLSNAGRVTKQLEEREQLYTQVFPDMGLCLLHCITSAVDQPVFLSCTPRSDGREEHAFIQPYFQGTSAAVLMLIPDDEAKALHQEIFGYISGAFVRDPEFVRILQTGDETAIREKLTEVLRSYFYELLERL